MKAEDCLDLIKNEIKCARLHLTKTQTEWKCLKAEINRLEDLAFKIERNIEKDGGVDG